MIANDFALGYAYQDVLDADQEGEDNARCLDEYKLNIFRYTGSIIYLPSFRTFAFLRAPTQAPSHYAVDTRHSSRYTTGLV